MDYHYLTQQDFDNYYSLSEIENPDNRPFACSNRSIIIHHDFNFDRHMFIDTNNIISTDKELQGQIIISGIVVIENMSNNRNIGMFYLNEHFELIIEPGGCLDIASKFKLYLYGITRITNDTRDRGVLNNEEGLVEIKEKMFVSGCFYNKKLCAVKGELIVNNQGILDVSGGFLTIYENSKVFIMDDSFLLSFIVDNLTTENIYGEKITLPNIEILGKNSEYDERGELIIATKLGNIRLDQEYCISVDGGILRIIEGNFTNNAQNSICFFKGAIIISKNNLEVRQYPQIFFERECLINEDDEHLLYYLYTENQDNDNVTGDGFPLLLSLIPTAVNVVGNVVKGITNAVKKKKKN